MKARTLRFGGLLWKAACNFLADHGPNHAAAVAHFSLLSLGPFLYILGRVLSWLLPGATLEGQVLSQLAGFLPAGVAPHLKSLGTDLKAGRGLLSIALPGLAWVATTAFSALEVGVNVAFGTCSRRRFWLSRLKAFAGTAAVAGLLVVSLVANHATAWFSALCERIGLPGVPASGGTWISYLVLLGVTFAAFTWLYKILPRGNVAWRSAAQASLVTLVLWEGARRLFSEVLLQSPAYGLLTGALAGIAAFLLWIYAVMVITLYGAELGALLNGNRGDRPGRACR